MVGTLHLRSSTVALPNGYTVVMGGLIGDEETLSEDKIPLLGDIPGLGYLFKTKTRRKVKRNLFIFVTPHILRQRGVSFDELHRQSWIAKMKASMRLLGPQFNAKRMVREYAEEFYLPSQQRYVSLASDGFRRAKELASWKERLRAQWKGLKVVEVRSESSDDLKVGDAVTVRAVVLLGH